MTSKMPGLDRSLDLVVESLCHRQNSLQPKTTKRPIRPRFYYFSLYTHIFCSVKNVPRLTAHHDSLEHVVMKYTGIFT
jgi:hypothetical protein